MFAWIRLPNETPYQSLVVAIEKMGKNNALATVFNRTKTRLIKVAMMAPTEQIHRQIVIFDDDTSQWWWENTTSTGCMKLVADNDKQLAENLLSKNIKTLQHIDALCTFLPAGTIKNMADARQLMDIMGGFHDAHLVKIDQNDDELHLQFAPCWGLELELWFSGECYFQTYDWQYSWWMDGSLFVEAGMICLCDGEEIFTLAAAKQYGNCFWGRRLRYEICPTAWHDGDTTI